MTHALSFSAVGHVYGDRAALTDVSFDIGHGEILCLLGPSGCGKTTALRIAAGLERPAAGTVAIAGATVSGDDVFVAPEERGVGLLFQDYALFPHLSVARNVRFGVERLPAAERDRRVKHWLDRVGLWHRRRDYPHALSGGEQQRVALARALAPNPAVLLLDEPFSNLDAPLRSRIRDEVMAALDDIGAAALMVTHDQEEALYMGNRIAVMNEGRILQTGSPLDLYYRPASVEVTGFFSDINRLSGHVRDGLVHTAVGAFPAPGMANDSPVQLCLRAEGVGVRSPPDGGQRATVTRVRRLGRSSRVSLRVAADGAEPTALLAHVPGMVAFDAGAQVSVRVDPSLVFVFPCGSGFSRDYRG